MKLTSTLRHAIKTSVMNDVPETDHREQQAKLLIDWALTQHPLLVKRVWDDKDLRPFIACAEFSQDCAALDSDEPAYVFACLIPLPKEYHNRVPLELQHQLAALQLANDKQQTDRWKLEREIDQILSSCSTTNMLKKQCPEFEKYIPKDAEKTANLPAVTNLVANLIKAGWPKQTAASA